MKKGDSIPLVVHEANAEDEATGDAFEIFKFRKVLDVEGRVRIPRAEMGDSKHFLETLISKNLDVPLGTAKMPPEVEVAVNAPAEAYLLYSSSLGWRDDHRSFVFADRTIGRQKTGRRQLAAPIWIEEHDMRLGERGTLKKWQSSVATPALKSSAATFAISAAFAAPLLSLLGRHSCGFNIFGRSKGGKSTALLAGASVIGIGDEPNLPNWAASGVSTIESARMFNDMILPLNEMGLIKGSEKEIYNHVRQMIGEGVEAQRSVKSAYAVALKKAKFRTIFVSSSEKSISAYANLSNSQRDEGEFARCLDIPMSTSGSRTIIDNTDDEDLAGQEARSIVRKLRKACSKNYGTAYPAFIEFLISEKDKAVEAAIEHVKAFKRAVDRESYDEVALHALDNMALVYAGAQLAIDAGILPWPQADHSRIMVRVLGAALAEAQDNGAARNTVVVGAQELERRLWNVVSELPNKGDVVHKKETIGYIDTQGKRCILRASAIPDKLGVSSSRLAKLLVGKGILRGKKTSKLDAPDWYQRSVRWPPGGSLVRSVEFMLPDGFLNAT